MSDLKGLLSLARKAGYVVIGVDNLSGYDKKLFLLLHDKSAGKSLVREMNFLSQKRSVPLAEVDGLEELMHIPNCKAVGIRNKKFSEMILTEIEKLKESE